VQKVTCDIQPPGNAADYARWDARDTGGTIDVFDKYGQLYRKICINADALANSAFVLPSV
jgi:hypothetical protein